jgi:plastocyanin
VTDNTISGGVTGVFVQDPRGAVVEENTMRHPENAGVWFERSAALAASVPAAVNAGPIEISARDVYFEPKTIAIPAETDVTFTIRGDGAVAHSFVIDALGISVNVPAGTTRQIVINAPPGTYVYSCDIPGHREAGMVGTLVVAGDGASAREDTEGTDAIRGNAIEGGRLGIVVKGAGAPVTVAENRVTDTERTGVSIEGGAEVVLRENVVTRAGASGIVVREPGTTATLEENIVSDAAEAGISAERGAHATIGKANLVDGGKWGITILSDGTTAEVRDNRVLHVTNQGISVLYGARATIDGNSVTGGNSGIDVRSEDSNATVTGNFVSNAVYGILVQEGATAERIAENTILDSGTGIAVEGTGTTATVADNRIRESSRYGLRFSAGAHGRVSGNEISGAGTSGMRILDSTTDVDIRENRVLNAGSNGIDVSDSRVTIVSNTIAGSGDTGIWLGGRAEVEVTGNSIVGPGEVNQAYGPTGVLALAAVHGAITGNEITGHANARPDRAACGVEVRNGATDLVLAENHFPAPGNEQDICDGRGPIAVARPGSPPIGTPVR